MSCQLKRSHHLFISCLNPPPPPPHAMQASLDSDTRDHIREELGPKLLRVLQMNLKTRHDFEKYSAVLKDEEAVADVVKERYC